MSDLEAFVGIADTLGIESFHPIESMSPHEFWFMSMRCRFNPQRCGVIYRVILRKEDAQVIKDLLSGKKHKEALLQIKRKALEVAIGHEGGLSQDRLERMWAAIPHYDNQEVEALRDSLTGKPPRFVELAELSDKNQMNLF